MSRSRPLTKLGETQIDIVTGPEISTGLDSIDLFHKKPCWDIPREGMASEIKKVEQEFPEVCQQQEKLEKLAAIDQKLEEKNFDDMHKTQLKLRKKFIDVSDFAKECISKTVRTQAQIENELKVQQVLKTEIRELQDELGNLTTFEMKFAEIVSKLQPIKGLLKNVIEMSDAFESIEELMTRFEALMLSQSEISGNQQDIVKHIENIRQQLQKLTFDTAQNISKVQSEIAEIGRKFSNAKAETFKWEKILSKTKESITEQERETTMLNNSIHHIFQLMSKRNGKESLISDPSAQLDYVVNEMEILEEIIRRSKKLKNSSAADDASRKT